MAASAVACGRRDGGRVRWYSLTDAGREAATCLWAAERLRACGCQVPAPLAERLHAAVRRWRDEAGADVARRAPREHRLEVDPGRPARWRHLGTPGDVVHWAMASGACDQPRWQPEVALPTVIDTQGIDPCMVPAGPHPVWQEELLPRYRSWHELSEAGVDAMIRVAALQHLRARGFAVPEELEVAAAASLRRWFGEMRDAQAAEVS